MNEVKLVEIVQSQELETFVGTEMAKIVVEFGRSIGCTFTLLPYRGMLDCPVGDSQWIYEPYTGQQLHKEAERRLFLVGTRPNVRIAQVVYGHEVEEPVPIVEWEHVQKVAAGILSTLVIAAGIAVAVTAAALTQLDPALIIVLDDEEKTWIQICTWL